MKRKLRRGLMVLLALIFVGSLGMVIYRTMEYKKRARRFMRRRKSWCSCRI